MIALRKSFESPLETKAPPVFGKRPPIITVRPTTKKEEVHLPKIEKIAYNPDYFKSTGNDSEMVDV